MLVVTRRIGERVFLRISATHLDELAKAGRDLVGFVKVTRVRGGSQAQIGLEFPEEVAITRDHCVQFPTVEING